MRKKILEAAILLIGEKGIDAVSMREIANLVGVHMATIYHYFEDKGMLYEAVVRETFERHSAMWASALSGSGNARSRLKKFIRLNIESLLERSPARRIMERVIAEHSDEIPAGLMTESFFKMKTELRALIEELCPSELNIPWEEAAGLILGIGQGIVRLRPLHARFAEDAQLLTPAQLTDFLTEVVVTALTVVARKAPEEAPASVKGPTRKK